MDIHVSYIQYQELYTVPGLIVAKSVQSLVTLVYHVQIKIVVMVTMLQYLGLYHPSNYNHFGNCSSNLKETLQSVAILQLLGDIIE